jgi:VanZ family protein
MGVIFYMSSKTGVTVWSPMTYVAHFAEYLVLGALLCVALRTSTPMRPSTTLAVALVIASLYGVSDEIHQAFVPTRQPDVLDWFIDTLGASAACGLWALVGRKRVRDT